MRSLHNYCHKRGILLKLYFDQLNTAYGNNLRRTTVFNTFLISDFLGFFDSFVGFVSATNDVLLRGKLSQFPKCSLGSLMEMKDIKAFSQSYLETEDIPDADIVRIVNFVGRNLYHLRVLLDFPSDSIRAKCEWFADWFEEEVKSITEKHRVWLHEYQIKYPHLEEYCRIVAFADTGVSEMVASVPNYNVWRHLDNRYFIYDEATKLLVTSSPAARLAIMKLLSSKKHDHNLKLMEVLETDCVAEATR